jgi:hypothetical protein
MCWEHESERGRKRLERSEATDLEQTCCEPQLKNLNSQTKYPFKMLLLHIAVTTHLDTSSGWEQSATSLSAEREGGERGRREEERGRREEEEERETQNSVSRQKYHRMGWDGMGKREEGRRAMKEGQIEPFEREEKRVSEHQVLL